MDEYIEMPDGTVVTKEYYYSFILVSYEDRRK